MKLSDMRELLTERGIRLTKSLGQNFLHDGNQLRRIVAAAELTKSDKVLEIGPGLGPLTELLLAKAGEVLAVEKDARFVKVLRERFRPLIPPLSPSDGERVNTRLGEERGETPVLHLMHDDALEFLQLERHDWSGWKLVANLPYSVASPIIVELAQSERGPERMVVTLQLEVAQRLVAQGGESDYGVLSLLVQLCYEPHDFFKIPATCFFPQPDVDSVCVTLIRRPQPLLTTQQSKTYVKIVKRAFSQRRKMMFKLLKNDWPVEKLAEAFEQLDLSAQARAETVTLNQFVQLTGQLHP